VTNAGPITEAPLLSVVLPTFNERENIVPLVGQLRDAFRESAIPYEILVVDDRSPDGTSEVTKAAFREDPQVVVIDRAPPAGLALSIRDGIEKSHGNIILVMDTDFNHKPKDAVLLYAAARIVDLSVGSRFSFGGGMPDQRRYLLSYIYNLFMRLSLSTRMDDNLSGFFAAKRTALFKLDFDKIFWGYGDYFFRMLLLSQRAQLTHIQVPVFYGERVAGESKTRLLPIFAKYTRAVFQLIAWRLVGKW
jgi:dolichol-phosphate mannosyltransferase